MIKRWTKKETETLKQNMDGTLAKLKTLLPEKTEEQILEKIRLLYRANPIDIWTDEELHIIKVNPRKTIIDLMKLLPNRTYEAIKYQRYKIHGANATGRETPVHWKEDEIETLKKMKAEGYTNYEIADALGRPLNSVIGKVSALHCVNRKLDRNMWTKEHEYKIHECLKQGKPIDDLVPVLGRTLNKIYQKCLNLGYTPVEIKTKSKENKKDVKILKQNYEKQLKSFKNEVKILSKDIKMKDKTIVKLDKKVAKLLNVILKA